MRMRDLRACFQSSQCRAITNPRAGDTDANAMIRDARRARIGSPEQQVARVSDPAYRLSAAMKQLKSAQELLAKAQALPAHS
jgi:type IV secretory pathway VirJ component